MENKLVRIPQWAGIIIILALITSGASLTIISPLYANGLINVIIPILILTFFKSEFFEKLKLSTLAVGRLLVVVTFLGFLPGDWLVQIIIWLLRINILEAMLTDYRNKSYFNVISGLALIGSSFIITGSWLGSYYVTTNAAMLYWAIAYTLWNWDFVIHEFKHQVGFYHLAVLTSPLVLVLLTAEPGLWLIARANTLTFAGIFQIIGKKHIEKYLFNQALAGKIAVMKGTRIQLLLMAVTVALCLMAVVGNSPGLFTRGFL